MDLRQAAVVHMFDTCIKAFAQNFTTSHAQQMNKSWPVNGPKTSCIGHYVLTHALKHLLKIQFVHKKSYTVYIWLNWETFTKVLPGLLVLLSDFIALLTGSWSLENSLVSLMLITWLKHENSIIKPAFWQKKDNNNL